MITGEPEILLDAPILLRYDERLASLVWTLPADFQPPAVFEVRYGHPGQPDSERLESRGVKDFACAQRLSFATSHSHQFCWRLPQDLTSAQYAAIVSGGEDEPWLESNSVVWNHLSTAENSPSNDLRRELRNIGRQELPLQELRFLVNETYSHTGVPHYGPPVIVANGQCVAFRYLITDPSWRLQSRLCRQKSPEDCLGAMHPYQTHKMDRWQCHRWETKGDGKWMISLMASLTGEVGFTQAPKVAVYLLEPAECSRLC